jgi:TRAP-type uncharacterized transport system fused permease subunit
MTATLGVVCLAAGLLGYLKRRCAPWERALLIAAALLLIKPGYITDGIGIALLVVLFAAQKLAVRRAAAR